MENNNTIIINWSILSNLSPTNRFLLLQSIHYEAWSSGKSVIYPENKTIYLEIPEGGSSLESIYLPPIVDFNGCTIDVTNNLGPNQFTLFSLFPRCSISNLAIGCEEINSGDYSNITALNDGNGILVIEDDAVWTQRDIPQGVSETINRRDVVLLKNRKAQNATIAPYNQQTSLPHCTFYPINDREYSYSNLTFIRNTSNGKITNLLKVIAHNNVTIQNINVFTNSRISGGGNEYLTGDTCFQITRSTNVLFSYVDINGTYASYRVDNGYGYGIYLETVWNCTFDHLTAFDLDWGLFGNNNVNSARLINCEVNNFDAHSYGADFVCIGCTFHPFSNYDQSYTRYSSFFGSVLFEDCTFIGARPVQLDGDYKTYTGFDVILKDCTIEVVSGNMNHYLINVVNAPQSNNPRPELNEICLPNVIVHNLIVKKKAGEQNVSNNFYLFHFEDVIPSLSFPLGYFSLLTLLNVTNNDNFSICGSNQPVSLTHNLRIETDVNSLNFSNLITPNQN
jgi:hypothetical protein